MPGMVIGFPTATWNLRLAVGCSVASTYIAACVMPAVAFQAHGSAPGWFALVFGWLTLFPWWANICLLMAAISWMKNRVQAASSMARLAATMALGSWIIYLTDSIRLLVGYYLWQLSMLQLVLATWWVQWTSMRRATGLLTDSDCPSDRLSDPKKVNDDELEFNWPLAFVVMLGLVLFSCGLVCYWVTEWFSFGPVG